MITRQKIQVAADRKSRQKRLRSVLLAICRYLGSVVLGIIAFVGTPLKDWVFHRFWGERVTMNIRSETGSSARVNGIVEVRVDLFSNSIASLPNATVEIKDLNRLLEPTSRKVEVPGLSSVAIVPPSKDPPLLFHADKAGEAKIVAIYRTHRGEQVSSPLTIPVRPRDMLGPPTSRDYSGRWSLTLGPYSGRMELQQDGIDLHGTFRLDDGGPSGRVFGNRDQSVALNFLWDTPEAKKWVVIVPREKVTDGDSTLGMTGRARLYFGKGDWKSLGEQDFSAHANMRSHAP